MRPATECPARGRLTVPAKFIPAAEPVTQPVTAATSHPAKRLLPQCAPGAPPGTVSLTVPGVTAHRTDRTVPGTVGTVPVPRGTPVNLEIIWPLSRTVTCGRVPYLPMGNRVLCRMGTTKHPTN
eukprot:764618-Hanusia_phi.AAC.2